MGAPSASRALLSVRVSERMTITPVEYRRRSSTAPSSPFWRPAVVEPALAAFRRTGGIATALALPLVLLAIWSLASRYELVAPQILPAPSVVWATAVELIGSGQLQSELSVSLLRLAAGVVIGGTALAGGRASVLGSLWGAALSVILLSGLIIIRMQPFWQLVATGIVLIMAVAIDQVRARQIEAQ